MPSFRSRSSEGPGKPFDAVIDRAARLRRPGQAQHQDGGREIETGDRHVDETNAQRRKQSGTGQSAGNARAVLGRARQADRPDQSLGRHDVGQQRAAHAEIRRTYQAHDRDDDHDIERSQMAGQRQRHDGRGERGIGKSHRGQQIPMPDSVSDHPEYRRDQCPDILQRCEHGQQQHRAGLDHDVPAEHERLHLKRPGGEQIGRPLEAVVSDMEWRKHGNPRSSAQDAMTRFTAFPALFFVSFLGKAPLSGSLPQTIPMSNQDRACGCQLQQLSRALWRLPTGCSETNSLRHAG